MDSEIIVTKTNNITLSQDEEATMIKCIKILTDLLGIMADSETYNFNLSFNGHPDRNVNDMLEDMLEILQEILM